jgi:hypothetical protein
MGYKPRPFRTTLCYYSKSRHRALGDFKRTSRDGQTISIAQPSEALKTPRTSGRGGMLTAIHPQALQPGEFRKIS